MSHRSPWTLLPLLTLAAACGGGNGGSDPSTNDPGSSTSAPDTSGTSTNIVSLSEAVDPGTVVFLKVTNQRDRVPSTFRTGHAMRFTVTVAPEPGFEDALGDLNLNVGLVEAVATEDEQEEAATCFILQLNGDTAQVSQDSSTNHVTFVGDAVVPSECVEGLKKKETRSMNVWVSLNAPTVDQVPEGADLDPADYNTQFFTRFADDTGAQTNRNDLCRSEDEDGNALPSCILDLQLGTSRGYNLELHELDLESTLFIASDDVCSRDIDFSEPGLEASVGIRIWGSDPHTKKGRDHKLTNALVDAKGGMNDDVTLSAAICPAADAENCVDGTSPLPLFVTLREEQEVPSAATAVDAISISALVVGEPSEFHFDTHIQPTSSACRVLTGAPQGQEANWSSYSTFLVRYCVKAPFKESGPKGNEERDNCQSKLIKMVFDPVASADARSLEFDKTWSKEVGNSVVSGQASFGTENRLDTSGVRAYTYATAGVGGWLNVSIVDAEVEGNANTSIQGSSVRSHIDVFGRRLYSVSNSVPTAASRTLSLSGRRSYSKSRCVTYNYGLAGVGFNATVCAQGSAGVRYNSSVALTARTSAPMAEGRISGTVSPFVGMDLTARASLNLAAARGSVEGTLDLVDVSLPTGPALTFTRARLTDTTVAVTWNVDSDLTVNLLNGAVTAWVDLRQPAWCKKKKWGVKIKYPCAKWKEVAKRQLVNFNGFRYAISLLDVNGSQTLAP